MSELPEQPPTPGEIFRAQIDERFDIAAGSPSSRLVLDQLVRLLDELAELEAAIAEHGVLVRGGNNQLSANPALASARQHRLAIARLSTTLGLGDETQGTRSARRAAAARWGRG